VKKDMNVLVCEVTVVSWSLLFGLHVFVCLLLQRERERARLSDFGVRCKVRAVL